MLQPSCDVIFIYMYKPGSLVKAMERTRRKCVEKFISKGANTKKPANWKEFLTNDENKMQLIQVLQDEWSKVSYAEKLMKLTKEEIDRKVILICEGKAYQLHSDDAKTTVKTEVVTFTSS